MYNLSPFVIVLLLLNYCNTVRLNVLNAAINVKPQGPGEGRRQAQENLTFSWKPGVKFPSPQAPTESQFPAPGVTFSIRVKT